MSTTSMQALRLSTRAPARFVGTAFGSGRRTYASQPPRSQSPPAQPKQNSSTAMYAYVAIGLGIGGAFAFLLGSPGKAAQVAQEGSPIPGKQSLKGGDEGGKKL